MRLALRALVSVRARGVLSNAFTLAPVPGAIVAVGGHAGLRRGDRRPLRSTFADLEAKAGEADGASLVPHARAHRRHGPADGNRECRRALPVVEDCAHTMGAAWAGTPSGRHGAIGWYSTQT